MSLESPSICSKSEPDSADVAESHVATFHLDGPTRILDRRTHAYRKDVADIALAGTLFAPHYAAPMRRACRDVPAMIRNAPGPQAEAVSQLLPGEPFAVLDLATDWAWGYSVDDHYVGYVEAALLGEPITPTHKIAVREALIFGEPSIKSAVVGTLPFGARVAGSEQGPFVAIAEGFLHHRHVQPAGDRAVDPVAIAELLLGMPYLWGGRGSDGIDCSGLVQVAMAACGIALPRDTDQQRGFPCEELSPDTALRRGDIIHFPGHVGLMVDTTRLIHANAHWMAVVIEPLADVVARLAPNHDRPILARRRLSL